MPSLIMNFSMTNNDNGTFLPFFESLSDLQKSDFCDNICKVTYQVITDAHDGDGFNKNYLFYIGVGGLLVLSEALGMTKKIPQGSLIELAYISVKNAFNKFTAPSPPPPEVEQQKEEVKVDMAAV